MRILLVVPHPPDAHGRGAIPVVLHAHLAAIRLRHRVTLVTVAGPEPAELAAVDRLVASGVEVHAVPRARSRGSARLRRRVRDRASWLASGWPLRAVLTYEPGVQQTIDRLLREHRFDVVHVSDSVMGVYDLGRGQPTFLTEHEVRAPRPVDWTGWARGNWYRGVLDEVDWHRWQRHQPSVWRRFDRLEVFTPRDAATVARIAPELAARVAVNPFAVEIPPAADPSREEDGLVTFVGHFLHAPNVDAARWLVAEIMPRLRARRSNTRLRIVGADPLGMVRGLAAADVDVAGFVPDIGSELARASVVAAPVRTGGGQRMKVLHSMALGKAVVTTMRGAEGLLLEGEPGALATADTADAIAAAIAALLDAPEARRCMGRRARALVSERHSVAAYARRLDAAYAEVRNARR